MKWTSFKFANSALGDVRQYKTNQLERFYVSCKWLCLLSILSWWSLFLFVVSLRHVSWPLWCSWWRRWTTSLPLTPWCTSEWWFSLCISNSRPFYLVSTTPLLLLKTCSVQYLWEECGMPCDEQLHRKLRKKKKTQTFQQKVVRKRRMTENITQFRWKKSFWVVK